MEADSRRVVVVRRGFRACGDLECLAVSFGRARFDSRREHWRFAATSSSGFTRGGCERYHRRALLGELVFDAPAHASFIDDGCYRSLDRAIYYFSTLDVLADQRYESIELGRASIRLAIFGLCDCLRLQREQDTEQAWYHPTALKSSLPSGKLIENSAPATQFVRVS